MGYGQNRRRPPPQTAINDLISILGREHSEIIGEFAVIVTDLCRTILNNSTNNNHTTNNTSENICRKITCFRDNILRHENYEDNVLIPAMRDVRPEAGEHLDKCIDDHRLLRGLVDGLYRSAEKRADGSELSDSARPLLSALLKHFDDEDNMCIPILSGLAPKQRTAFVERIGEVRYRLGERN